MYYKKYFSYLVHYMLDCCPSITGHLKCHHEYFAKCCVDQVLVFHPDKRNLLFVHYLDEM